jgi:hypothetical protein
LVLIPFGLLVWFLGLAVGLGAGDAGGRIADWLEPIAVVCFFGGLFIAAAGVVWVLFLLARRFLV